MTDYIKIAIEAAEAAEASGSYGSGSGSGYRDSEESQSSNNYSSRGSDDSLKGVLTERIPLQRVTAKTDRGSGLTDLTCAQCGRPAPIGVVLEGGIGDEREFRLCPACYLST